MWCVELISQTKMEPIARTLSEATGSWRRIAILDILDTVGPQTASQIMEWFEDAKWPLPRSEAYRHLNILMEAKLITQRQVRGEYQITSHGIYILETHKRVAFQIAGSLSLSSEIYRPSSIERDIAFKILESYPLTTSESVLRFIETILIVAKEKNKINDSDLIRLINELQLMGVKLKPTLRG